MRIGEYDMDLDIFDLGSNANVFPRQTWVLMGKPKLQWSIIQLNMENQKKVLPLGRLSNVIVGIDRVHTTIEFEVIEIVDDSNPYLVLPGLDWEFSNMAIINMKKWKMIFESNNMRVIVPLDP